MDIKNHGGPTYPLPDWSAVEWPKDAPADFGTGMTLRDWFAGQALAGFAHRAFGLDSAEHYSRLAYQWADAMLAERTT